MNYNTGITLFYVILLVIVLVVYVRDMYYAQKRHEDLIRRADQTLVELRTYSDAIKKYIEELRKISKPP
jgi:DNA integrity scanning protein DisA with diadenylate cyclase activity